MSSAIVVVDARATSWAPMGRLMKKKKCTRWRRPRAGRASTPVTTRAGATTDDDDIVLGVYVNASASQARAAPVNAKTGAFERAGAATRLGEATPSGVAAAVRELVESLEWEGRLGISLPGLVTRVDGDSSGRETMARVDIEAATRAATGCETSASSGAEAFGAAELRYGAGVGLSASEKSDLVMFCMAGRRFSASLYDDGTIVKNFAPVVEAWRDDAETTNEDAFADVVSACLIELEDKYMPNVIILSGEDGDDAGALVKRLSCKTKVVAGTLGVVAGVKGAAALAREQIRTRDIEIYVRDVIGTTTGVSPQFVTEEQLRDVFDKFDTSENGVLELSELVDATAALNVDVDDGRRLLDSLDYDGNGVVSFEEWARWWRAAVSSERVTKVVSKDEWSRVLRWERNRLVCLEVGFTFCRPCKAFAKKYEKIADDFPGVKFVFMNGNENGSTTRLARDELGVKTTPSFFLFRSGERVHFHSGGNEERLRAAINRHATDEEWPAALGARPAITSDDSYANM